MQKDKKYVSVVSSYFSVEPGRHKRWNIDSAQVPDVICQDLADDIGKDWKKLGRLLGISQDDLDIIHHGKDTCAKSIFMLNKWRENFGEKATVKVLTEALKKKGRKDLSDKVRGMNISSSIYLLNSSTFRRKRNCYSLN